MAKILAICTSEQKGTVKIPVDSATLIMQHGIEGDAHAGSWHRQVSLLSADKIEEFRKKGANVAYGAFGVSFVLTIIFLLRDKMKENGFWDQHIPKKDALDTISYRCVSLGMMFLTVTIGIGGIWAENAWGSYWSWDPKETWALVTWVIYLVYLHLRIRKGWNGKAAAIFGAVGFVCVLFTYIGVNTLLPGLHSYK